MKFKVDHKMLVNRLGVVSKVLTGKLEIKSLSGIRIVANSEGLTLTATDGVMCSMIETVIPNFDKDGNPLVIVEETGLFIVQGKQFVDYIKKLKDGFINCQILDGGLLHVKQGRSDLSISGFSPAEYPDIKTGGDFKQARFTVKEFKRMVRATILFVSQSESMPVLKGVSMKFSGSNVVCSSTDSFRMSRDNISVQLETVIEDMEVVVPAKPLLDMSNMLTSTDEYVDISFSSNWFGASSNSSTILTRLLSGTYPNLDDFLEVENNNCVMIVKSDLAKALERMMLLTNTSNQPYIKFTFLKGEQEMKVECRPLEIGGAVEWIELDRPCSFDLVITLSPNFVYDVLRTYESDELVFSFKGDMSPMLVHDPLVKNSVRLLVPIRLN